MSGVTYIYSPNGFREACDSQWINSSVISPNQTELPIDFLGTTFSAALSFIGALLDKLGVTFDSAATSGYQAASGSYSFNHTVAAQANRLLVVEVSIFVTGTVSNITYGGVGLTHYSAADVTNGAYRSELWYLIAPAVGTGSVAVTLSGALTSVTSSLSYYNADQTAPFEAVNTNSGTGGTVNVAVTTVKANSVMLANLSTHASSGVSSDGNAREVANGALGTMDTADKGPIATPASTTITWSGVGALDLWAASAVSIKPPATSTLYTQALSGALSFVGGMAKLTNRSTAAALSFSGAVNRLTSRALPAAALSFVGSLAKRTSRALSGALSFSGAFSKTTQRAVAGALSFVGSINRFVQRPLTASLSFSGAMNRVTSRTQSGALSFSGLLNKRTSRALAAALSFSGAFSRLFGRAFAGTLSFSGLLNKTTSRAHSGALGFSGAMNKRTSRALAGALSYVGTLNRQIDKSLTGSLSFSGAMSKRTSRAHSASLSFAGSLNKLTSRALAAALSFLGDLIGTKSGGSLHTIAFTASLAFSGTLNRTTSRAQSASLAFSGALTKRTSRALAGALSFSGAITRQFAFVRTAFAANLSFVGAFTGAKLGRAYTLALASSLSFAGALNKRTSRMLPPAVLSFSGTLNKLTARAFAAVLSFIGAIASIEYRTPAPLALEALYILRITPDLHVLVTADTLLAMADEGAVRVLSPCDIMYVPVSTESFYVMSRPDELRVKLPT